METDPVERRKGKALQFSHLPMAFFSLINLQDLWDIYGGSLPLERVILCTVVRAGFLLGAVGLIFVPDRLKILTQGILWFLLLCQVIILLNYFFWTERISPSNYIPGILWLAYTNFLLSAGPWYRMVSGVTVSGMIFFSLAANNYNADVWISISSACIFLNLAGWALPFFKFHPHRGDSPEDLRLQAGRSSGGEALETERTNPNKQGPPQAPQSWSDPILEGISRLPLSKREKEIVFGLVRGSSRADIALKFFISEETVKKHVYNIYYKLDIRNRVDLVLAVLDTLKDT